jgi:hypothetical protein
MQAQTGNVATGDRVKLDLLTMPPGFKLVGRVLEVSSDTIHVAVEPNSQTGDSLAVALNVINEMQISRGMGTAGKAGIGIGASAGFVGGAIFGFVSASGICSARDVIDFPDQCTNQGSRMGRAAVFAAVGLAAGGVLGYLIGSEAPKEQWQKVVVSGMRLSMSAVIGRGLGGGISLSF